MAPSRLYSGRAAYDEYDRYDRYSRGDRIQSSASYDRPRKRASPEYEQRGHRRGNHSFKNSGESSRYYEQDWDLYRAPRGEEIYDYRSVWPSTRRAQMNYQYHSSKREAYHDSPFRRRESSVDLITKEHTKSRRRESSIDYNTTRKELFPDYVPGHEITRRGHYERRPYRGMPTSYDYEYQEYRHSSPGYARGYATQPASRSTTKKEALRSEPRRDYHLRTFAPPSNYPTDKEPPRPLPLLVLDLNGTLVCREASGRNKNSFHPVLRPYLKSFLQYCLAISDSSTSREEHQDAWDEWGTKRAKKAKASSHGAHFWRDSEPPEAKESATYRLLLWSSAQPQNVDAMARAILSPEQAEQLLRIYARDTLVTNRLYSQKAPSVKDLEILWAVLNKDDIGKEAEARLFAEARNREDEKNPDLNGKHGSKRRGASERAAEEAQDSIVLPMLNEEGAYEDGKGYGQHNTLLLDDSVDKAKLQPFNHLLLPEFDRARAVKTVSARNKFRREGEQSSDQDHDKDTDLDDVLLQVIGVLEHARYQVNVSCWIRFGGLGNFGGMGKQHPYYLDEESDISKEMDDKIIEEAIEYFSKPLSSTDDADLEPRLHAPVKKRTVSFWVQEGKRALMRHGIPLQRF